jgi:hypothetical protein
MAAPSAFQVFAKNINQLKLTDIASVNIRVALVASTATVDTTVTGNNIWANLSANEIAGGTGYTSGGFSATGSNVTSGTTGYAWTTTTPSWVASGAGIAAWRYCVIYYLGALWGVTDPLIGYFIGDSAPADIPLTAAGNTLQINVPAAGWFTDLRT